MTTAPFTYSDSPARSAGAFARWYGGDAPIFIAEGDSLEWLGVLSDSVVSLVYIDPPFNTGATQRRLSLKVARDADGERVGFGGHRYRATSLAALSYEDRFTDYLAFLEPRLREVWRVLKGDGSVFVHLDAREVHYVKVLMDGLFGRESFINEIIWSYDYGGRPKNRWPAKHDTILWYAKDPKNYTFNYDEIDRIPYMAPSLVGAEKAARGKTPTDVWWHTIVPTNSKEKTGYPTQKPLGILERIVRVHSCAGDLVLDFFAGSGTTGAAASNLKRRAFLVDNNADAIATMKRRFAACHQEMQGL